MKKSANKLIELEAKISKKLFLFYIEETKIKREEDKRRHKLENKEAIRILKSVEPMHRKIMEKFHNNIELPEIQHRQEVLKNRRSDTHHK